VRLDQLVQQLVEDSAIEAAAHGCSLQYQTSEPVTIAGDPELLRRAVENVLRNAIRYAPRDTTVEVGLSHSDSGAVVKIRDHGPGVPEDALPRIFDPFYRVEPDRNRLSGGIGLGLSIARRAVELHRGSIRAANANPGLEIDLEFPVA
jgi:two-component system sensor histidine kinase CpxA